MLCYLPVVTGVTRYARVDTDVPRSSAGRGPARMRVKANSRFHALPSPAMTTPPGWEPRPGPPRGEPARRAPRGAASWPPEDTGPRRQGDRSTGPAAGRGLDSAAGGEPGSRAFP